MNWPLIATSTYTVAAGGTPPVATTVPVPEAQEGQTVTLLGIQADGASDVAYAYLTTPAPYSGLAMANFHVANSQIPVALPPGTKEITVYSAVGGAIYLFWNVS
jgi:hypothetical protein